VPFIGPTGELKTKPAQHSVRELRSIGIQPDAVVCRSDRPLPPELKRKIAMLSDVDIEGVVSAHDAESLYSVPLVLREEGLDDFVVRRLGLDPAVEPDLPSGPRWCSGRRTPPTPSRSPSSASTCRCRTPTCRSSRR
jgi:CTP synthase